MKLRYKIKHEQFKEIVHVINIFPYNEIDYISHVDYINLKAFYIISINQNNRFEMFKRNTPNRIRALTIDLNHWNSICKLFFGAQNIISPYTLAIHRDMCKQLDSQIYIEYDKIKLSSIQIGKQSV